MNRPTPQSGHRPTTRLRELINRKDRVLWRSLHPPSADLALGSWRRQAARPASSAPAASSVHIPGLADVGSLTMLECVQVAGWIAQAVEFPGHHGRRHRPWRHHGGPPHGARMHSRRHRRGAHRRPADRRQAAHPERGRDGGSARSGDRALSRRGRHERTNSILISSSWRNAMRAMPRTAGFDDTLDRLKAYREEGRRRLGAARIAAFRRGNCSRARCGERAVLVHEGQAAALSHA